MDIDQAETAIGALRRATAPRHVLLESVLQLLEPLIRERYVLALTGFDLFLSTWEPRLAAALPEELRAAFLQNSRLELLSRDIDVLGRQTVEPELAAVCVHAANGISLPSVAAAFGSLYVLEGSALGSQIIARAARETLGMGPENGAAYFNGSGRQTAAEWKVFRGALENRVGIRWSDRDEACAAAEQTFDALIYTFAILRKPAHVA